MEPQDRAAVKEIYRTYLLALDVHVHNPDSETAERAWSTAYKNWVKVVRKHNIGRFDREAIHEEVLAELATVL